MNRKYIIVSFSAFIASLVFILGFNFILGDKILFSDSYNFNNEMPIINYIGVEEDENIYKIKVSVKNNSDYYASISNISLKLTGVSEGYPIFNGYDNNERQALINYKPGERFNYSYFLDPYEEREYAIEISKKISFDKETFSSKEIDIGYGYQLYKYKINNNNVIGMGPNGSGSKRISTDLDILK